MPKREELLAMLKNSLKKKVTLSEEGHISPNAKCCNQTDKCSSKDVSVMHIRPSEEGSLAKTNIKSGSLVACDPKNRHLDEDTSSWAKKTEEFLMKLQNMEAYSSHEDKGSASTEKTRDLYSSKRKSKSQSKWSESPESPPKKKSDSKTTKPRETHSETEQHAKKPANKLRKAANSDYVSKNEIWETIEALKREIFRLEKKRHEMSSKPSKQNEKIIADSLKIEQEMKSQIRDLWKAIIDRPDEKRGSPLTERGDPVKQTSVQNEENLQSLKGKTRFVMTFNKPQSIPATSGNMQQKKQICSKASGRNKSTSADFHKVSFKDGMKEKDNPMANAMSEGVKYATSMYSRANNFYDGGNLWCQVCNTLHKTIWELSLHLYSPEHIQKIDPEGQKPETVTDKTAITTESAPARGDEFFRPIRAYSCLLCKCTINGSSALSRHFTSIAHNLKFKEFLTFNEEYEVPYLTHKMAVILRKELQHL